MSSIDHTTGPQGDPARDAAEKARDVARQIAEDARKASSDLAAEGSRVVDDVKHTAQSVADDVRHEAESLAGEAVREARALAQEGKGRIAVQVASLGAAIGKAADDLDKHDQPMLAGYARRLGEGVQQASHTMHDKGVEELLGMVGDFARRQPAALIGGAVLLGFVASRFAKASAQHDHTGGPQSYASGSQGYASRSPLPGEPTISEPWPTSAPAGGTSAGMSSASSNASRPSSASGTSAGSSRPSATPGTSAGAVGGSSYGSSKGGF